mmetsp:Transcript_66995/g.193586  ORF Transcript_66995/g.193586 Transcript_66995/m.193586 type:complete len:325 (+) Transcript_66995:2831-3805(+)
MEARPGSAHLPGVQEGDLHRPGALALEDGQAADAEVEEGSEGGGRAHGQEPKSGGAGGRAAEAQRGVGGRSVAVAVGEEELAGQGQAPRGHAQGDAAVLGGGQGAGRRGGQARSGPVQDGHRDGEVEQDAGGHAGAGCRARQVALRVGGGQVGAAAEPRQAPGSRGAVSAVAEEHSDAVDGGHDHGRRRRRGRRRRFPCRLARRPGEPQRQRPARRRPGRGKDVVARAAHPGAGPAAARQVHGAADEPHVPPPDPGGGQAAQVVGLLRQRQGAAPRQGVVRPIELGVRHVRHVEKGDLGVCHGAYQGGPLLGRSRGPLRQPLGR